MRRYRIPAALALLLLPPLARGLWFYRGVYRPPVPIDLPRFEEIRVAPLPVREQAADRAKPVEGQGKTVLIDFEHENQFQWAELEALSSELDRSGARIELVRSSFEFDAPRLSDRLKYASAYVVIAPLGGFSDIEARDVTRFVARGGRLLVILDPTRSGGGLDLFGSVDISSQDIAAANPLLEALDLSFTDDYLYNLLENEGNYRNVFLKSFADHPVTEGLEQIVLYAARSITSLEGTPLVLAEQDTLSSRTDAGGGLVAAALSPDGGAIALGDLTFMTPPYDQVGDNARLIHNLASFLLAGERERDLTDLPFLFDRPVEVLISPIFGVQAETLGSLRSLQDALDSAGIPMTLSQRPSEGRDLIVLALFEPAEETDPYIDPLGLTLPVDHADGLLDVPGFGEMDPSGIGVLGFSRENDRNTLIVLAEDKEKLSQLADSVGAGLLSDCVLQASFALCKTGEGAGFGGEEPFDFNFEFEESLPEEPVESP